MPLSDQSAALSLAMPSIDAFALTTDMPSSPAVSEHAVQPANNYSANLPVELMSLIFEFLVPNEFHSHCDTNCCPASFDLLFENQPLGLLAVCRTWRAVALFCRALWSRVSVDLTLKCIVTQRAVGFMQDCLNRSGQHPLSVGIYFDDEHAEECGYAGEEIHRMISLLEMLVAYRLRWKTLFLGTNNIDPQALMFPLGEEFPVLEHLILDLQGYCSEQFNLFGSCPRLRTVELRLQGDGHLPKINLEQSGATIEHIAVTTLADCDFDTEHCLRHLIFLLDQCWNLSTLIFEPQVSWLSNRGRLDDDDCIDLFHCQELVVYDSRLFDAIVDLSRLEKLTIIDRMAKGGDICRRLQEALNLSSPRASCGTLTHITLHTNLSLQFVNLLKRTPNVSHLTLGRDPTSSIFEPHTAADSYEPRPPGEDPCECECWALDLLIHTLVASTAFLPKLRHLSIIVRRMKQWYLTHTDKTLETLLQTRAGQLETFKLVLTMKTRRDLPRSWWSRATLESVRAQVDVHIAVGLVDEDGFEDSGFLFVFPGYVYST